MGGFVAALVFFLTFTSQIGTEHLQSSINIDNPAITSVTEQPILSPTFHQTGTASWYGPGFEDHKTASGKTLADHGLTAAHRSLPFNSKVKVTNLKNGKSVNVTINDRGPFTHGRVIDLSADAAHKIGMQEAGLARVRIEQIAEVPGP